VTLLLVATGGTIASRPTPEGVRVGLSGSELVERAGVEADAVEVLELGQGPSWAFTSSAVERLARTVVAAAASRDVDGVVITHGTDTLEESAFLTWLLGGHAASERCPIVFTAAMHHAEHPDADGPANLRDALALAAGGKVPAPGPVVRVAGGTHHARWARKRDTSAVETFESVGAGAPAPPASPPPCGDAIEWAVAEVHSYTGVDPAAVDLAVERGARGVVLVGTGAGNAHADLAGGIVRAVAADVPVVVTSRCWTGPVAAEYGGPCGGRWLADAGCILAGDLPTNKARLALSVALGVNPGVEAVRAWFGALVGDGAG
jgi:L-asparaginase